MQRGHVRLNGALQVSSGDERGRQVDIAINEIGLQLDSVSVAF